MLSRRDALIALGTLAWSADRIGQDRDRAADDDLQQLQKYFEFTRGRSKDDYAIVTPNGIDESKYLRAGGIEHFVTIRGENRTNPVLLIVHGGPGDATNPWGYAGFRKWLHTFTVVQWDQRGAGRTLDRNGAASAETLSVDQLAVDGVELADELRTALETEKIIVLGHSFGSMVGILMAKKRPELFQAYIGTGQVGNPTGEYDVAFQALLSKARALGDTRALKELEEIGPPPYKDGRGYQVQRRWSNFFEGADAFIASMAGFALNAPGYTLHDFRVWLDGMVLSANRLIPVTLPTSAIAGRIAVPVFVIQGDEDFTTPTSLAKSFVQTVEAPRKEFVTIRGGHFAAFMNTSEFLARLTGVLGAGRR
jgi:pimeloyl-ACP methyl ester carboxylesterase